MKINLWQKMYGARRRAIDRKLLASLERDIADGERIARKAAASQADDMPMHQITEEQRRRIAAAFGRPC